MSKQQYMLHVPFLAPEHKLKLHGPSIKSPPSEAWHEPMDCQTQRLDEKMQNEIFHPQNVRNRLKDWMKYAN